MGLTDSVLSTDVAPECFDNLFSFDRTKTLQVGIERECFITRDGVIVPEAPRLLSLLPHPRFSYELSACQLEERIGPCEIRDVGNGLRQVPELTAALRKLGLQVLHQELAPCDMPLDIYPDPTGRYQRIVETISADLLRAACRVAATHVHVGMPDREVAVRVHDRVLPALGRLCSLGDRSQGRRLQVYRVMARDWEPKPLGSWKTYRSLAREKGFFRDPRQCWRLIRISVHGTIEFRMFGATGNLQEIESWARECHRLCQEAL